MKEEITDFITDKAYEDPKFKKGLVLRFQKATIKITRVDRKNKRTWGQHITMMPVSTAMGHYGHNIDLTVSPAYCTDCEVSLTESATEEGEVKATQRKEAKDGNAKKTKG